MFLGLGSNAGDSRGILRSALGDLRSLLAELRASSLYRTKPRYVTDQPDFLNQAVCGYTDLEPIVLLDAVQAIEARHGRDRSKERFKGPRTLDVDILIYGDIAVDSSRLILPHPGLKERAFVLVPLIELDPGLRHPVDGSELHAILASLPDQGIYPVDGERL